MKPITLTLWVTAKKNQLSDTLNGRFVHYDFIRESVVSLARPMPLRQAPINMEQNYMPCLKQKIKT
jgi:hypothetical protein